MLLNEAAMVASGDSKAGCKQPEKELPILSRPNHELTSNQKKRRRKKRAKLGRPASAEVGLADVALGPADSGTPFGTSWLQDWETASNDSVLTPQHSWPPAPGRGSEGRLAQSSMVTLAAATSAADQQQRHGFRAAACLDTRSTSPAPEGGKQGLEGSSMPAPAAKRQKTCPTTPRKPVTRQHRLAPASQGICRVDLSAAAAAAVHPDAAGSLALPAGLETPSREPAAAAQNVKTGTAAAAPASAAAAAAGASQQAASRQRKARPVFLHGNYSRYYGYRVGHAFDEDPRMQVFKRAWFQGRRCLDIGCNSGAITLSIAAQLAPRSMLGVDIDASLIRKACSALAQQRSEVTRQVKALQAPAHLRGPEVTNSTKSASQQRKAVESASRALASTWFEAEEFVTAAHEPQTLDTVLCLSVTKWVHLNQGDDGVKQLFQRVRDVLTPGGYFILEPQPWRSYQQTLHKQDMSAAPFASLDLLHLRPENFVKYLVQELHFTHVQDLEVQSSANGFNRPIHLLRA